MYCNFHGRRQNIAGGVPAIHGVHKCARSAPTRGVWGMPPRKVLDFRPSEIPYILEKTPRLLFSALPLCSDYSRAATIRNTADVAATIYFSATAMRRLFEGGYYSRCGVYSRKYGSF